ncbi:DUF120 domain-containing protein [Chloroflexota bacterium]
MKSSTPDSITIKGKVVEGLKASGNFTHIPWVRQQFIEKLGINPYPGTLNLDVSDTEYIAKLKDIRERKGIEIVPAEAGFCSAKCFHVLICGSVKGAAIIPLVSGYPESKLEIISACKIMDTLSLSIGDLVAVDIYYNG